MHEQTARIGQRLPHLLAIAPDVSFGADTLSSPLRGLAPPLYGRVSEFRFLGEHAFEGSELIYSDPP